MEGDDDDEDEEEENEEDEEEAEEEDNDDFCTSSYHEGRDGYRLATRRARGDKRPPRRKGRITRRAKN